MEAIQLTDQSLTDYQRILLQNIPLIDVRAPIEFQQGAMPAAINLPLMNDEERAMVGTCYKQQGRAAAVVLGHQLISGKVREQRINAWRDACQRYPDGYLCCARGGMRSLITQRWLWESGIDYPVIAGGYKALRQVVIQTIEYLSQLPVILIGGCTGSGKTDLVNSQPTGLDLEQLARHRGSSFGRTILPQSGQASFENRLAVNMMQISTRIPGLCWVLEDEGRMIGVNNIPEPLRQCMSCAPIVVVEEPFECRVQRIRQQYFIQSLNDFQQHHGEEEGWQHYADWLRHGLNAIRRRLGEIRYQQCSQYLEQALVNQQTTASPDAHLNWLIPLLEHYYDPMYRYQLSKKTTSIQFRGDYQQVQQWLTQHVTPSGGGV